MATSLISDTTAALTLRQLHAGHNLQETLSVLEAQVRKKPISVEQRWTLEVYLSLFGQWGRVLKQLLAAVRLVATANPKGVHWQSRAQMMRGLIRAGACTERRKASVSDAEEAQSTQSYDGLCDRNVAGGDHWLACSDIALMPIVRVSSLHDLLWLPVTLTLHVLIPTRYSGTQNMSAEGIDGQHCALLPAHLTLWHDVGATGVFAQGRKTLMTEQGGISLLDIRSLDQGGAA